ncbi:ArsR family transcriptional regulator [Microbacterium sp. H1-D42]|uniref:helix-turn-helix transcriptional regulator n=1 Tax=Microbacterium sp. H1-D42 TaxID=2925844 RepID=UPI001F5350F2|nr:ArsR family transcriptional regulator [Microbacterium sp. H1-D42]UNK70173.1 ArsR family transcriptional regulator [Microbacterium sp. H1-D42]
MEKKRAAGDNLGDDNRRGADGRRYSSTRERILREVESRRSATTSDIVAETGLHENTVREHLERLRSDGRLRRVRAEVQGRGRPGWRWETLPAHAVNPYAGLALALADTLARVATDPVAQARLSGAQWGVEIAAQQSDATDITARELVVATMREQGFEPDDTGDEIILHRCPLLAAAARRSDVVCAVHEGMIEGIAGSREQKSDAELLPFQADGACILHLRAHA